MPRGRIGWLVTGGAYPPEPQQTCASASRRVCSLGECASPATAPHRMRRDEPMNDLWTTLLPLVIGSAVVPIEIAITVLLLQSPAGRSGAVALVAGMLTVRGVQGIVFGLVLGVGVAEADASGDGPGPVVSTLLLLVAIVFLISAARKLLKQPDEDEPPPKWQTMVETATPGSAFLLGAGLTAINVKLWAFTLGAIGSIVEAEMGQVGSITAFVAFSLAAVAVHLVAVALAYAAPARSEVLLARASGALKRWNRAIMVTLGLLFGAWFLVKALAGLGVL